MRSYARYALSGCVAGDRDGVAANTRVLTKRGLFGCPPRLHEDLKSESDAQLVSRLGG